MPLDLPTVHIMLQTQRTENRQSVLLQIDEESSRSWSLLEKLKLNLSLDGDSSDIDPSGYFSMKDLVRAAIRFGYARWHISKMEDPTTSSSSSTFKVLGLKESQFESLGLDDFVSEVCSESSDGLCEISLSLPPDANVDAAEKLLQGLSQPPPPPPPKR